MLSSRNKDMQKDSDVEERSKDNDTQKRGKLGVVIPDADSNFFNGKENSKTWDDSGVTVDDKNSKQQDDSSISISPKNGNHREFNGNSGDKVDSISATDDLKRKLDTAEICKTVSPESPSRRNFRDVNHKKSNMGRDSPKIIPNPWSFFNRFEDKRESRYNSEEEERLDNVTPTSTTHDVDFMIANENGNKRLSQHRANDIGESINSQVYSNDDTRIDGLKSGDVTNAMDETTKQKNRRKFQFFNIKRMKDKAGRKQNKTAPDFEGDEGGIEDPDRPAAERAARLVTSLSLGAPAINFLASCLMEDEHGIARAPLLLSILGLKVNDISPSINTTIRKFRIDLEYGVGPQRLKWSVERTAKDLLYLHSKFKFERWRNEVVRNKNTDLPKYPIPPLLTRGGDSGQRRFKASRMYQGSIKNDILGDYLPNRIDDGNKTDDAYRDEIDSQHTGNHTANQTDNLHDNALDDSFRTEHPNNDNGSLLSAHSLRENIHQLRAHLSGISSMSSEHQSPEQLRSRIKKNQEYIRDVSNYLNELIKLVSLKPQSNRLFQFFEISPISSLLSYETGYSGKQGVIHIGGTTKSQGWRVGHFRANDLKSMIDRRSEKWLLIRHSYVLYVSDINSTSPLEVFMVDPYFKIGYKGEDEKLKDDDESDYDDSSLVQQKMADIQVNESSHQNVFKHLKITLENGERKLVLIPKSRKEQKLWIQSLQEMKNLSIYSNKNRFGSFAPIREKCFAQWFVDGRDYFWAVSSALEMAKDVIFIHDWWLTPELYLRRPANGNQQWRIDRILQRKAQQGVKIFVIIYRNVGTTVATDSLYTKHSILSLNEENIHVIRSPNQLLQNTYFWAHHEKLCIIDQTVAFLGGIDLCYGRFDTPDHVLVDDSKVNFNSLDPEYFAADEDYIKFQTFPGKDYSNPRVKDFFNLDKPYESMYDRNSVPRMPWHDVHMVTSGKVARDLARHFVQRWNYLLRQKRPSRYTPLLTPPPDLSDEQVRELGMEGTCEVQLLRSSGNWSLGLKQHEQSIQNAYLKLIETSQHFVYIENQFFVTSCFIDGNEIHNRIGDALVDRIIKAYKEGTNWKAIIVIPLMPGFESQVDEPDGSAVRVIMQCQYMSISRGSTSIFAKLRKYGIDPEDYIQFYSLRKWGIIGPDRHLVTEQLYIHAKTMIVDDRAAIIGSANINERSMRGVRDSEVAAIIRDKETINTKMDGKPYLAGKFAHTLRMRLMREHLGVSVDILDIVERRFKRFENIANSKSGLTYATNKFNNKDDMILSAMVELASRDILNEPEGTYRWKNFKKNEECETSTFKIGEEEEANDEFKKSPNPLPLPVSFNNRTGAYEANRGIRDKKKHSYDTRVQHNEMHKLDVKGDGPDKYKTKLARRARLNNTRFLKDLAHESMQNNPTASFLPDLENVKEFLECDDFDMVDEMDEESEKLITERNKERWELLKKISYLQRVAAKDKSEQEEEAKKRSHAGMQSGPNVNSTATPDSINSEYDQSKATGSKDSHGLANTGSDNSVSEQQDEKKYNDSFPPEPYSDDIPIVSLDEEGVRGLVQNISSSEESSPFIDPYCFEDPLDEDFFEDVWYEFASRNTEIFRMVFHTQPDNLATSWNEYKRYSRLQKAFKLLQQKEAKNRRSRKSASSLSNEDSDSEDEGATYYPSTDRRSSQATINVKKLNDGMGLLGEVPPPEQEQLDDLPKSNMANSVKKKFKRAGTNKGAIPEEQGGAEQNGTEIEDAEKGYLSMENGSKSAFDEKSDGSKLEDTVDSFAPPDSSSTPNPSYQSQFHRKKRRAGTFSARRKIALGERIFDRMTAERILKEIKGHIVFFPTEWLSRELEGGNWFYNTDRIPPIDIYD